MITISSVEDNRFAIAIHDWLLKIDRGAIQNELLEKLNDAILLYDLEHDDDGVKDMPAPVMRAGGRLVKDWGTHFLRDDTEIRREATVFDTDEHEAYSLFSVDPFRRVQVFCGSEEYAIREATKLIASAASGS